MRASDYRALLAQRGAAHWWSAGMRRIAWALLGPVTGRVLDLGCGPGWELAELPASAWGVGVDLTALPPLPPRFVQADAGHLPCRSGFFDVVLALDLLEQRAAAPAAILAEAARVLKPGGRLLIRVPAHPWLIGPHDVFWGGARRYHRAGLAAEVLAAGFTIRRLTYANGLLFPFGAVERLLARALQQGGDDLWQFPRPLNALLAMILALEARWLAQHDLPLGLSLICLAEKQPA